MSQLDRVKEAQRAARGAARRRWIARRAEREKNLRDVADRCVGAADSPNRNARFQAREAAFAQARVLRRLGQLPIGIERKIGPTLDWSPFAPSDGARKAGRPVARVVALGGPGIQPEGFATAFLVTSSLLMTNHHVFPSKADAVGTGANFLYEQSDRGLGIGIIFEIDPDAFYVSDENLDVAVVGIKKRSLDGQAIEGFGSVALIEATPKILIGQPVNIIQHPEGGPKRYAVSENRLVDLLDTGFLHYDTDTLEGSSGSPAFSENWQLVGLHHAGIPQTSGNDIITVDGGVWDENTMSEDRIKWIANEGIRVSSIVKYLGGLKLDDPQKQVLLDELMASTTDPVDDLARETATPVTPPADPILGGNMSSNSFNFTGPVTIHVYAPGGPAGPAGTTLVTSPQEARAPEKIIRFDPAYKKRKGYDPDFLGGGLVVPVPRVGAARSGELLKGTNGKPLVLKYHHYELVMNEDRFMQMWSAVNVDYDPRLKPEGNRESFGSDKWIPDPRIPGEIQIQDPEFYEPAKNIDRGHIVRREDNAWGKTDKEIEFANSDTFHWTNCTPQHEAFNQSTPGKNDPTYKGMKGLWGDFENHVQKNLGDGESKACILAGPVLSRQDPLHDFGLGEIKYPLRFWKVVAVAVTRNGNRELGAFGFLLSQRDVVKKFGIETFQPGKFKKYQVSLQKITASTGVEFDAVLHAADVLANEPDKIQIVDGQEKLEIRR